MARRRMGIWILVLVAVVIVGLAIYSEVGRRQALAPVAQELGLSFSTGLQTLPPALDAAGF